MTLITTVTNDSTVIKRALIEIMKTTCIKFVPRIYEPDYAVFMKYKHPTEARGFVYILFIVQFIF